MKATCCRQCDDFLMFVRERHKLGQCFGHTGPDNRAVQRIGAAIVVVPLKFVASWVRVPKRPLPAEVTRVACDPGRLHLALLIAGQKTMAFSGGFSLQTDHILQLLEQIVCRWKVWVFRRICGSNRLPSPLEETTVLAGLKASLASSAAAHGLDPQTALQRQTMSSWCGAMGNGLPPNGGLRAPPL